METINYSKTLNYFYILGLNSPPPLKRHLDGTSFLHNYSLTSVKKLILN